MGTLVSNEKWPARFTWTRILSLGMFLVFCFTPKLKSEIRLTVWLWFRAYHLFRPTVPKTGSQKASAGHYCFCLKLIPMSFVLPLTKILSSGFTHIKMVILKSCEFLPWFMVLLLLKIMTMGHGPEVVTLLSTAEGRLLLHHSTPTSANRSVGQIHCRHSSAFTPLCFLCPRFPDNGIGLTLAR